MTEPESINGSEQFGGEGFPGMRQLPKDKRSKGQSWEDEGFKKYLRLRNIAPKSPPDDPKKSKKEKDVSPEKEEKKKKEERSGDVGKEKTKTLAIRKDAELPEKSSNEKFILNRIPTDMKGIVAVMYLLEFIKKRIGTDGISNILHHYMELGWFSPEVLEVLLSYSKMIVGDLGYFECDWDEEVPTTTTLHHSKVLEIIYLIRDGVDIATVKDFETFKLIQIFDSFTGKGVGI